MAPQPKILVVDDEVVLAETTAQILAMQGYAAECATSAEAALECVRRWQPSLVVMDVVLPGMNGVEAAMALAREWPQVRVLLVSGQVATTGLLAIAERERQSFPLLAQPVSPRELLAKIQSLLGLPAGALLTRLTVTCSLTRPLAASLSACCSADSARRQDRMSRATKARATGSPASSHTANAFKCTRMRSARRAL
ncbi:MAG: response regulator transcription factor [Terriglobales bacterium]